MPDNAPGNAPDARNKLYSGWPLVSVIACYSLLVALLFRSTVASMVDTWLAGETYTHCFLILPISLWMVWRQRDHLVGSVAEPRLSVLLISVPVALVWLLAYAIDVKIVQQLAFVTVLITGIWAILGTRLTMKVAFPLGFLYLAVPMGAGLIPPLMELTASSLEVMVRSSGIPVYREGMYLTLPSGNWSVVQACSGIRYLIASLTLGVLYARLSYQSPWRRAAFICVSIVVPVIANSLRAYMIVMIGHLSDMKLATGVDHLIYGWVFFGVVMLLLFWIGGFWQEDEVVERVKMHQEAMPTADKVPVLLALILTLAVSGLGPGLTWLLERHSGDTQITSLRHPAVGGTWISSEDPGWGWLPNQKAADRSLDSFYSIEEPVGLYLRQYLEQSNGAELVQSEQPWLQDRKTWQVVRQSRIQISLAGVNVRVAELTVKSGATRLLVWSWFRIHGQYTSSNVQAKFLEAWQQVLEGRREGSRVFVATRLEENVPEGQARLQAFLDNHWRSVEHVLDERYDIDGVQ